MANAAPITTLDADNTAPEAQFDVFFLDPRTPSFVLSAADLLANDSDPDEGDTIRIVSVASERYGTAELVSDEAGTRVVFTPSADFLTDGSQGPGEDFKTAVFEYTIADESGATSTTGVVLFPTFYYQPDYDLTLAEDTSVVVFGGLRGQVTVGPQHGRLEYTTDPENGLYDPQVVYVPDRDFFGTDSFEVVLYDLNVPDGITVYRRVELTVTPVDEPSAGYVRGTPGGDLIDRSSATDRVLIAGLDGNDTLRGGGGNDALNGGAGADVISGGAGNDLITGGAGADRMAGGRGADTFLIARGDLGFGNATDLIVDFQGAGAAGGDVIRFTGFGSGAVLERIGTVGNAGLYEVQDGAGANLGRLLVSAGGTPAGLAAGDYAFV